MQYKPQSTSNNSDITQFLNTDNQTNNDQHGIQQPDNQFQRQQHQLQHHQQLLQRTQRFFQQEREQRQRDGGSVPPLIALPNETLTGISAYLAPPSLLAFGQVSRALAEHIRDDHTWRVAFLCGWIGLGPNSSPGSSATVEADFNSWKTFLLDKSKREDRTWRQEYIWRFGMIRRWSRSTNPTATHTPVHSLISGMRLVALSKPSIRISPLSSTISVATDVDSYSASTEFSVDPSEGRKVPTESNKNPTEDNGILSAKSIIPPPTNPASLALLTSSTQYGIVARSQPILARVGTGYLDAIGGGARGGRRGWPGLGGGWAAGGVGGWVGAGGAGGGWIGNGNPNVHFRPDVMSSDITVDCVPPTSLEANPNATTPHVYVLWGTRTGEIVLTYAARALDGFISGGTGARSSTTGATVVSRSGAGEGHEGIVKHVKWVNSNISEDRAERKKYALTAGVDGRVKLWEVSVNAEGQQISMQCIWTSTVKEREVSVRAPVRGLGATNGFGQLVDECVRVEGLVTKNKDGETCLKVVCVSRSGDVRFWSVNWQGESLVGNIKEILVPRPSMNGEAVDEGLYSQPAMPITLAIDPCAKEDVQFLVAYQDDTVFYRVAIELACPEGQSQVKVTPFGNPAFGQTSLVVPYLGLPEVKGIGGSRVPEQVGGLVFVGDRMGCVSLYRWDAPEWKTKENIDAHVKGKGRQYDNAASLVNDFNVVGPIKTFEAHRDGASVTALWWDGLVLVTGSARGTTHVWDALTFDHLRSFVAPFKKERGSRRGRNNLGPQELERERERMAVRQVHVNSTEGGIGDVLVVAVGDVILSWQAGRASARSSPSTSQRRGNIKGRSSPPSASSSRTIPAASEIRQAVSETQTQLALEKKEKVRKERKEKQYKAGLEKMGLGEMSESEMVEYLMMLSMEEEERREAERLEVAFLQGEQIDEGVFEPNFEEGFEEEWEDDRTWSSSASSSGYASAGSISSSTTSTPTRQPRIGIPTGSIALHSSPSANRGESSIHPGVTSASPIASYWANPNVGLDIHTEEFPPIPGSADGSPTSTGANAIPTIGRISPVHAKEHTPSGSPKSLPTKGSAWSTPLKAKLPSQAAASTSSSPSSNRAHHTAVNAVNAFEEEMDEDLRFALELSLVEARSRAEAV